MSTTATVPPYARPLRGIGYTSWLFKLAFGDPEVDRWEAANVLTDRYGYSPDDASDLLDELVADCNRRTRDAEWRSNE